MKLLETSLKLFIVLFLSSCSSPQSKVDKTLVYEDSIVQNVNNTLLHKVIVEEVIHSSKYTYLKVKEKGEIKWIGFSPIEAVKGETYAYDNELKMTNFIDNDRNQNFPIVYFVQNLRKQSIDTNAIHSASSNTTEIVSDEKIEENSTSTFSNPQDDFKKWLLENTSVTEVHYESDWQIWVTLEASKYTSESNVEEIAKSIARWYANKMNKDFAICTVWLGKSVYAKGDSN
ncbi:MAG TPA: hypothetical protein VFG54_01635 [Prolixibacteraceae bacterium]|nr:hypothetical protein [Prolixibacteraceae bacterium]